MRKDHFFYKELPFIIDLQENEITFCEIFKFSLKNYTLFYGEYNGHPALIKVFTGKHAQKYFHNEMKHMTLLKSYNVNTLSIIFSGKINAIQVTDKSKISENHYIVVMNYDETAKHLGSLWKDNLSDEQELINLYRICEFLANLFRKGLILVSLKLENFFIINRSIYLADCSCVARLTRFSLLSKKMVCRSKALDQFAKFFAILPPKYDEYVKRAYLALIKFESKYAGFSLDKLVNKIQCHRTLHRKNIIKRLATDSRFFTKKTFGYYHVVTRSLVTMPLLGFMKSPETIFNSGHIFNEGLTNTVSIVTLADGFSYLVKRYQCKKRFKWIKMLKKTRARKSWQSAWLLKELHINTPEPVAFLEKKCGPLVLRSYILFRFIPSTRLIDFFSTPTWPKNTYCVIHQVKLCLHQLEKSLIYHGDLKATNFIINNHGEVFIVDLDSMKLCKNEKRFIPLLKKDTKRFMKNWLHNPDVYDLFISNEFKDKKQT